MLHYITSYITCIVLHILHCICCITCVTWNVLPCIHHSTYITLHPRLDVPGSWPGTGTNNADWSLRKWFDISPANKLVSLTWLLFVAEKFRRFTFRPTFTLHFYAILHTIQCIFTPHVFCKCKEKEVRKNNCIDLPLLSSVRRGNDPPQASLAGRPFFCGFGLLECGRSFRKYLNNSLITSSV